MSSTTSADSGRYTSGETLVATLAAIGRHVRRQAERPSEFAELTGAQLELVRLVRRRPGISVVDAASELHLAPNTVSTLVRQLSIVGSVYRRTDDSDRRVARLDLSPEMRHALASFRDRRLAALNSCLENLTREDRRALDAAFPALERLAERLRESEQPSAGNQVDTDDQRSGGGDR